MNIIRVMTLLLSLILLLLAGCHESVVSLVGYAVAPVSLERSSSPHFFVSCPSSFTNQGCIFGNEALIRFHPLFQVWSVSDNELIGARMIFGKPECVYQKKGGANIYRLQGEILNEYKCVAEGKGFSCF